jgi:hypothetical protein
MKEFTILREEVENLSDKEATEYVIDLLLKQGFDLSDEGNLVTNSGNAHRDYIRFTQEEKL